MIIREIKENDADKLLELRNRIERESPFMLQEPEERDTTVEEKKAKLTTYCPAIMKP